MMVLIRKRASNIKKKLFGPQIAYLDKMHKVENFKLGTFKAYFNQKKHKEREPTRHALARHDETELLQVGAVGLDPADEAVFEAPQLLSRTR
jgi:hypothetical protein